MKSLWKCLFNSMLTIAVTAGASATVVAQDAEPVGVVRISRAKTTDVAGGQVQQASASQTSGSCAPVMNGSCAPVMSGSGAPMTSTPVPTASCDPASTTAPCDSCQSGGMFQGGQKRGCRSLFGAEGRFAECPNGDCWGSGFDGNCPDGNCPGGHGMGRCRHPHQLGYSQQDFCNYFRCKFGYFIPTGGGGQGLPWVGHYSRVYPVNPYYNDSRDGQAYAAQGYGVPISVPLAPVVGHTYEYGWGIPSSRLVPVSRPAY